MIATSAIRPYTHGANPLSTERTAFEKVVSVRTFYHIWYIIPYMTSNTILAVVSRATLSNRPRSIYAEKDSDEHEVEASRYEQKENRCLGNYSYVMLFHFIC